jgi:hypothetical protein
MPDHGLPPEPSIRAGAELPSAGSQSLLKLEKVWGLPPARWWARWRHVVRLGVLTGYLNVSAGTTPALLPGTVATVGRRSLPRLAPVPSFPRP